MGFLAETFMKHLCNILKKTFESKADMYRELTGRKSEIMQLKKAIIKHSDDVSVKIQPSSEAVKSLKPAEEIKAGDYIYPVINTTKVMDSHDDVHIDGIWNKSAKEQNGKTFHVIDHDLSVSKIVGWPDEVEVMVKEMAWKDLGESYSGTTEALIFKTKLTNESNKDAFNAYAKGRPVQHSVRMQYVNLKMAINDKDYKEEYAAWKAYYDQIVNKERADEMGYFFPVLEAKIYKEGSMVLGGSNHITPSLYDLEPSKHTPTEPPVKALNYNYLIQNLKL